MTASIFRFPSKPQSPPPQPRTVTERSVARSEPVISRPRSAAQPEITVVQRAPKASWSASSDVALLAVLEAPLPPWETAAAGFARKEAELRHIMATLTVAESRALQSRLSNPKSGDQLADAFLRMTADRRARLINFLADARRREALR